MEEFQGILNSKRKWTESSKDRLTMMQVLIKTADLSTAARGFQTAEKFSLNVCEEFFRQGQLDKVAGFSYEFGYNDRDHLDKERSQIPFYKEVCWPLFQLLGKGVSTLGTLSQHLKLNISKWEEKEEQRMEEERKRAAELAAEEEEAQEIEDVETQIEAIELDEETDEQATEVLNRD
jgi:hypothetical protein